MNVELFSLFRHTVFFVKFFLYLFKSCLIFFLVGNLPEGMEYSANNPKFFIDNGYLYYYFAYGVIALSVILFIYTVFIYRAAREGHYTLLAVLITISLSNFVNATMLFVDLFIPQVFILGFLNYFISGFTKNKDIFYTREFKNIREQSNV